MVSSHAAGAAYSLALEVVDSGYDSALLFKGAPGAVCQVPGAFHVLAAAFRHDVHMASDALRHI